MRACSKLKNRSLVPAFIAGLFSLLFAPTARSTAIGATIGYAINENYVQTDPNEIQPPLFSPYDRDSMQWWYNLVEEAAFSNLAFIALSVRGESLNGVNVGNAPASIVDRAANAINTRGYTNILKIGFFDDTGPYLGSLQQDNQAAISFDMGNVSYWQTYWWNLKWKQYFQLIPDQNRMKINGRPLIFIWSIASGLGFSNQSGHLSGLINYLRSQCQTTFGFNPFIIVDSTWVSLDPAVGSVVDGVNNWFTPPSGISWTKRTHNGASGSFTTGICVSGFWTPGTPTYFLDRSNGNLFKTGLSNTIPSSNVLLIEGFTDVEENAGLYRASISSASMPGVPGGQRWTWPNQYLDILREYTAPNPLYVVLEAEAADEYSSPSAPPGGIYRRGGGLNISYVDGTLSNWAVLLNLSEWLQFDQFQLGASSHFILGVRYSSAAGATGQLLIDGSVVSNFTLPATGSLSNYNQITTGGFPVSATHHTIRLILSTGQADIDNWSLNGF